MRSKKMTRRKRRNHSLEFKAKVTIAAIKGDKTLAEMAQQFNVHPDQMTDWKTQLLERSSVVFGDTAAREKGPDILAMKAKIGDLALENDFFESALIKAGLRSARRRPEESPLGGYSTNVPGLRLSGRRHRRVQPESPVLAARQHAYHGFLPGGGQRSHLDAKANLGRYLDFYNTRRPQQTLDGRTPDTVYSENLPKEKFAA
jgi:transposase